MRDWQCNALNWAVWLVLGAFAFFACWGLCINEVSQAWSAPGLAARQLIVCVATATLACFATAIVEQERQP